MRGDGTLMSDGAVQSVITTTGRATGRHTNVWKGDGAFWRVIRTTGQPALLCRCSKTTGTGDGTAGNDNGRRCDVFSTANGAVRNDRTTVSFNYRTYCCLLLPHITSMSLGIIVNDDSES